MVFRESGIGLAGDNVFRNFPSLVFRICYSDSQTVFGFISAEKPFLILFSENMFLTTPKEIRIPDKEIEVLNIRAIEGGVFDEAKIGRQGLQGGINGG